MKVRIEMNTRQTIDGDTDIIDVVSEGILREVGDGTQIITYFQDGVHNEMRVDMAGKEIIVIRNWKQENAFHYKEKVHHVMNYETPMGYMELGFDTKYVEIDRIHADSVMNILLIYDVTQYGKPVSENEIRIRLTKI
ncbi:hypothetical protein BXO88_13990 [Oribacterium sp. C9]|uniref:DUF1934 domain-containing protein n=1 Tax=Oribacterium sp. C9 TaxID=1943579 RepID=UPI00098FFE04|nr:DUF1934 domain-containing protein [Oribacterium sp. C9]OON85093.1 hypothetical protein BXO88_13990 [Oribacterium sp. C9]